jgi:hypothetical protein
MLGNDLARLNRAIVVLFALGRHGGLFRCAFAAAELRAT